MIVRAGAPYIPNQLPLLPIDWNTINGRIVFGGTRAGSLARRRGLAGVRSRGLGAAIQYCQNNPPDAATTAIITGRGDSVLLVPCGGVPTPQGTQFASGNQPNAPVTTVYGGPGTAPVFQGPTGIEDCAAMGLATQAGQACVQRNTQRTIDNENAFLAAGRNFQTNLCIANRGGGYVPPGTDVASWCANQYGGVPGGGAPSTNQPPASPYTPPPLAPAATFRPTLTFQTARGGNTLQVGDQWRVTIAGGPPNAAVVVTGIQNANPPAVTTMGQTDGNGNFSLTGTATADVVGNWSESWTAGGFPAGSIQFTVAAPVRSGGAIAPAVLPPLTTGGGAADGSASISDLLSGSLFGGIPNWALLAGGVGLLVVLPMLGGRR